MLKSFHRVIERSNGGKIINLTFERFVVNFLLLKQLFNGNIVRVKYFFESEVMFVHTCTKVDNGWSRWSSD